tara:strand:- start:5187 stop:5666 length:480 start_codon:yes stop_codon:yes gene_type:complete
MDRGTLIVGSDEFVARWVSERIPYADDFGPCVAMAGMSGERMVAGFVYNDYQERFGTIQLSMAAISPLWAKREIMHGVLAYAFEQLGCFKVWLAIAEGNKRMRKVTAHIGFNEEALLAHHFGEGNHCVMERMLRPDYDRIFGELNGQEIRAIDAAASRR